MVTVCDINIYIYTWIWDLWGMRLEPVKSIFCWIPLKKGAGTVTCEPEKKKQTRSSPFLWPGLARQGGGGFFIATLKNGQAAAQ